MQHEIINDGHIIRVSVDKELSYTKGMGEILFEKLNLNKQLPMQVFKIFWFIHFNKI